jgi:AmmeMemoRadiSam system protein A
MHGLDTSENFLTAEEERLLLRIARNTLEEYVRGGNTPDLGMYELTPSLEEKHGAFVTLRLHGDLRGCIGYTGNIVPLARAVLENTVNAASHDPRFVPVSAAELPHVSIEISALTPGDTPDSPFRRVQDIGEIVIGRDGLYIEHPMARGGILLPQVPVEQGWDLYQFLAGVCRKAGYPDSAWKDPNTRLYRFSAQVFGEPEA